MYSKTYGTTRGAGRAEKSRSFVSTRERSWGSGASDRPRRSEGRDSTLGQGEQLPYASWGTGGSHVYERGRAYLRDDPSRRVVVPPNYTGHAVARDNAVADHDAYPLPDVTPMQQDTGDGPLYEAPEEAEATPAPSEEAPPHSPAHEEHIPPEPAGLPSSVPQEGLSLFGRGIGWEELLILGLIFFLLRESEEGGGPSDLTETILLLGALLVVG